MNVLAFGASRNIGYYAALRLLQKGSTVTFLLRNPNQFDSDSDITPHISSGKARIVHGDATKEDDVRRAWSTASQGHDGATIPVDAVLFTVGGMPKFSITKGFLITPPDLCTRCLLVVLRVIRSSSSTPKIILLSSTGITHVSHKALPLLYKPLYSTALAAAHDDKRGMERLVYHVSGWEWDEAHDSVPHSILPADWKSGVEGGWMTSALLINAALLTDGDCKADNVENGNAPYRVQEGELKGAYTVSRRDVAHFIVERALKEWDAWGNKHVTITY